MTVERRSYFDLHTFIDARKVLDDVGKIALQVQSQGEEVGNHNDARGALGHSRCDGAGEIGRTLFQEGSFD